MKVLIRRIKCSSSQDFGNYCIGGSKGMPDPLLLVRKIISQNTLLSGGLDMSSFVLMGYVSKFCMLACLPY